MENISLYKILILPFSQEGKNIFVLDLQAELFRVIVPKFQQFLLLSELQNIKNNLSIFCLKLSNINQT